MLPLWFKLVYTAFVIVLVPVYAIEHGWVNFLWFSNVALLGGLVAAWWESRWLASMLLMCIALPELVWILDFTLGLARGGEAMFGLAGYMFDPNLPLFVRLLSLYHITMPFVLFWMVWRLGYDPRAWRHWIGIGGALLVISFWLTTPDENVNWVYGAAGEGQEVLPAWAWLLIVIAIMGLIWWITHRVLLRLMHRLRAV
jgi:hypothetical protein